MTDIWPNIEQLSQRIITRFGRDCALIEDHDQQGWRNIIYQHQRFRRAHVEIVDFRSQHKIYILHVTVFPYVGDSSPIFGFDAVCGQRKITGAFHDFSAVSGLDHPMIQWFAEKTRDLHWKKLRALPPWAAAIFTPHMLAASNVNTDQELVQLTQLVEETLDYYLATVGQQINSDQDYTDQQNRYCYYQKQNPQVYNSMIAMGIDSETIKNFVDQTLFPEIVKNSG